MKTCAQIGAVLSFLFCLAGGLWLLCQTSWSKNDALSVAIGFYFVGKAFFVGPMLFLAAARLGAAEGKR